MKDFNWSDLRGFLAVVRTGRLTVAAQSLNIDHSTLSRQIARLESALETRLFDRHPAGYSLTAAGEWLVAQAEEVERISVGIQTQLADRILSLSGSIRIGSPEGFGTCFLAPRIGRFASAHPDLEIELIANPQVVRLNKREAEMAIVNFCPREGHLHAHKLTEYELGLYAAKHYLDRHAPIGRQDDIRAHPFIGYIQDLLPTVTHAYLEEVEKGVVPKFRTSNILTQLAATREGAGLCVLPCFMADPEPGLVRLFPAEIRVLREFWLVVHSDLRHTARLRAMADFLTREVRNERALFLPEPAPGAKAV